MPYLGVTGSKIGGAAGVAGGDTGVTSWPGVVGSMIVPRLIRRLDCSSWFLWTLVCTNSNSCLAREHLENYVIYELANVLDLKSSIPTVLFEIIKGQDTFCKICNEWENFLRSFFQFCQDKTSCIHIFLFRNQNKLRIFVATWQKLFRTGSNCFG